MKADYSVNALDSGRELALLACPFCGEEAAFNTIRYSKNCDTVRANGGQTLFHGVNCTVCGARTTDLVGHKTKARAVAAWNRRTPAAVHSQTSEAADTKEIGNG